jgi:hypothetical protein
MTGGGEGDCFISSSCCRRGSFCSHHSDASSASRPSSSAKLSRTFGTSCLLCGGSDDVAGVAALAADIAQWFDLTAATAAAITALTSRISSSAS